MGLSLVLFYETQSFGVTLLNKMWDFQGSKHPEMLSKRIAGFLTSFKIKQK